MYFIVQLFKFGRRDIPDRSEQLPVVEPINPFERGELDFIEVSPVRGNNIRLRFEEERFLGRPS